jgi:hypothetical protein
MEPEISVSLTAAEWATLVELALDGVIGPHEQGYATPAQDAVLDRLREQLDVGVFYGER